MRTICLINNHNYGRYLKDCIDSVFSQTVPFDEVILVDDGSTDDSLKILEGYRNFNPRFRIIFKKNEGQMSCFNAVHEFIDDESQVFFLDSDDFYPTDYLQNILLHMNRSPWEIAFSMLIPFEEHSRRPPISLLDDQSFFQSLFTGPYAPPSLEHLKGLTPFSFPSTSVMTRLYRSWIGMPTSSISILGSVLKKIIPFTAVDLKLAYADDIFVLGTSILGVNKHFLTNNGVYYRIHSKNMSRSKSNSVNLDRPLLIEQIIKHFCLKFGVSRDPSQKEFQNEVLCLNAMQKKLINLALPIENQII